MIEPKRIGRFLSTDAQGYIVPDVRSDLIPNLYRPVIAWVAEKLFTELNAEALYLRGSVPRGLAIPEVSDIDFMYLSETRDRELEAEIEALAKKRFPEVRDMELGHFTRLEYSEIRPPQTRPYIEMLLKTQSLFIAGTDLTVGVEPYRAGLDLAGHIFILSREFDQLPDRLAKAQDEAELKSRRQWFCRRLIRAGLEITLDRAHTFTRDLYLCCQQFGDHYPEYRVEMDSVLVNALNGHEDPLLYQKLVQFVSQEARLRYKVNP